MGCSVSGCDSPLYSSGLCSRHYNRKLTTGSTDDGPRARLPLRERFWRSVDRRSADECWLWLLKSQIKGYGTISLAGRGSKKELSHRVAWILTNGPLPEISGHHGAVVRHKCANRLCCNPAHLELGTQADNVDDMWATPAKKRGNARLTEEQVSAIRKDKRSSRVLAPIYGVCHSHISSIKNGRVWKRR